MSEAKIGTSDLPGDLVEALNRALEVAHKHNIVLVGVTVKPLGSGRYNMELVRQGNLAQNVIGDYLGLTAGFLAEAAEHYADSFSTKIVRPRLT